MNVPEQSNPQSPSRDVPRWLRVLMGTPLALFGGLVTAGYVLVFCAHIAGRIGGGHPSPYLVELLIGWLFLGATPLAAGVLLLPTRPSTKRFWWRLLLGVSLLFLVVGADGNLGPTNWHQMFRREKLAGTDAATLKQTVVSPTLDAQIVKGTNLLWCGTFQLAWNEACRLTGGNLQFERGLPIISALNKHSFTKDSLDEPSYIAMSGFVKDNIHDQITKAVDEKFHGMFKPRFIPDKTLTPRQNDFVAYACLYKNLSFSKPFERLDEALTFGGTKVSAFGIGPYKASLDQIYSQVLILDYQSADDFVIELRTKSEGDRLIFAKTQPKSSFGDTVMAVGSRIARGKSETAATNDLLVVPRIKLDLTREYSEIEGLTLVPKGTNVAKDLVLMSAVQNTLFEMNEKGVELRSEAHMAFGCAKQMEPVSKHIMIFDKPFLILMQRRDAKMPYFALWVDNPEVLIAWK